MGYYYFILVVSGISSQSTCWKAQQVKNPDHIHTIVLNTKAINSGGYHGLGPIPVNLSWLNLLFDSIGVDGIKDPVVNIPLGVVWWEALILHKLRHPVVLGR